MLEESDLERDVVQFVTKEATALALDTPLREPILGAVEERTDVDRSDVNRTGDADPIAEGDAVEPTGTTEESSKLTTLAQGLVGFVVMFVVLYLVLRKVTGDADS